MSNYIDLLIKARQQQTRRRAIAADLPDSLASKYPSVYQTLTGSGALIKAGTRIRWGDIVKKAAVDLWDTEQNTPDIAPTLWEDLNYYQGYRIIPEVITTTLAFNKDEAGYWPETKLFYKAKRDGVVHNPTVYPADWEHIDP